MANAQSVNGERANSSYERQRQAAPSRSVNPSAKSTSSNPRTALFSMEKIGAATKASTNQEQVRQHFLKDRRPAGEQLSSIRNDLGMQERLHEGRDAVRKHLHQEKKKGAFEKKEITVSVATAQNPVPWWPGDGMRIIVLIGL